MQTIHLEWEGKSARVKLGSLPKVNRNEEIEQSTSKGKIVGIKIKNGINSKAIDKNNLLPKNIIEEDKEIRLEEAGQIIDSESLTAAYFRENEKEPYPISDFKKIEVVYNAQGKEKERRNAINRRCNTNDNIPLKIGKKMSLKQASESFVFKHCYQLIHEDGVTREFLTKLCAELESKKEVALIGAGLKGNSPLIVKDKGSPYRGFIYGETKKEGNETKYKLVLMLSEQELKDIKTVESTVENTVESTGEINKEIATEINKEVANANDNE